MAITAAVLLCGYPTSQVSRKDDGMHAVGGRARQAPTVVGTGRLAAAGLAVIAVCYGLARFAYGLFVPAFTAEFGLGAAAAGAIASSSYAGYCVAVVVAMLATVRWGPRAVATAAVLAAVLGTGLIALAPRTPVLAVGVVVAGSSTGDSVWFSRRGRATAPSAC
jgi:MFS family permease